MSKEQWKPPKYFLGYIPAANESK